MFKWEIKQRSDEKLVVLTGGLDESCDLQPLSGLTGTVTFDLAGIRTINSEGARRWIVMLRQISNRAKLSFVRCSVPVMIQINMITAFKANAEIRSFYAPYLCSATGQEEERLLITENITDPLNPPTFPCEGGELELDDLPDRYFAFLLDERTS